MVNESINESDERRHEHGGGHNHPIVYIYIDTHKYQAPKPDMTGEELRNLAKPSIGNQYNLWLEIPGLGDDKLVGDAEIIHLHDGMCFYSALKEINPGATDAIA